MKSIDVVPHYHVCQQEEKRRKATKYYCALIGVLVGVFIELSSFCINPLYFHKMTSMSQQHHLVAEQEVRLMPTLSLTNTTGSSETIPKTPTTTTWAGERMFLSFVWSATTIWLGITLLLLIRALTKMILNYYYDNKTTTSHCSAEVDDLHRKLVQSIATGTLWGFSIAWILTDSVLGRSLPINNVGTGEKTQSSTNINTMGSNQSDRITAILFGNYHRKYNCYWYLPIIICITTLIVWNCMLAIINRKQTNIRYSNTESFANGKNEMSMPLLGNIERKCDYRGMVLLLRLLCFMIGTLVGIFDASSTFGATYIGQLIHENNSDVYLTSKTNVSSWMTLIINAGTLLHWNGMTFTVVSFIMSCFSIVLLLSIRALVMTIPIRCQHNIETKILTNSHQMTIPQASAEKTAVMNNAIIGYGSECSTDSRCAISPLKAFVLINIDQFLVTGAVFGLNVALMVSDYVLISSGTSINTVELSQSAQQHRWWIQSILVRILSMLWCPMLCYLSGYNKYSKEIDSEMNTDSYIQDIGPVHDPAFCDNTQHLINASNSNASMANRTMIVFPESYSTSLGTIRWTTPLQQQPRRGPYDGSCCDVDEEIGYI